MSVYHASMSGGRPRNAEVAKIPELQLPLTDPLLTQVRNAQSAYHSPMSADTTWNHSRHFAFPADVLAVDFVDQRSRRRIGIGQSLPVIRGGSSREQKRPGATSSSLCYRRRADGRCLCLEFVEPATESSNFMPPAPIV